VFMMCCLLAFLTPIAGRSFWLFTGVLSEIWREVTQKYGNYDRAKAVD
jgi:hypothetical protein